MLAGWHHPKPPAMIKIQLGPVASGSAVIQSPELITIATKQHRKLLGIDMESYAIFYAATNACPPRPDPFCIKSVCDHADEHKSDTFQELAAYTSANLIKLFCLDYL